MYGRHPQSERRRERYRRGQPASLGTVLASGSLWDLGECVRGGVWDHYFLL